MPYSFGSVARACVAACLLTIVAIPVYAQQPLGITEAPDHGEFLPRFDFNVSADKIAIQDQRFSWDTHWAADWDMVDYVYGRISFLADYQALLGSEYRPFDPYQSSYLLEASGSYRIGKTELLGVLNHISRHYGDRFNQRAVAENSLGGRVMRRFGAEPMSLELRADVRKVIAHAFVDYTSFSNLDLIFRRSFNDRTGFYTRGFGQLITVNKAIAGRDNLLGGRVEMGLHIKGERPSLDLFVGAERVIDADQLDRQAKRWAFAGFRISGK